jgi:two-component system, LytTR family, response regulator
MKQFLIPTNKGNKLVLEGDIIRIEACSNYCKIFFRNEHPLVVAKVLHWFQDMLPEENFCRIHRTHLVNRLYVIDIVERSMLRLSNGELLQISRRRKSHAGQLLRQTA